MILSAILANFYDFFPQKCCKDIVSGLEILILGKWDMWATVTENSDVCGSITMTGNRRGKGELVHKESRKELREEASETGQSGKQTKGYWIHVYGLMIMWQNLHVWFLFFPMCLTFL